MKNRKLFFVCIILVIIIPVISYSKINNTYKRKFYSHYYFIDEKLQAYKKIEVQERDLQYMKSFWIVYYDQNNKIAGEEYYENWRLYYYYIYKYTQNQIHKKGFYWHGITGNAYLYVRNRAYFKGYYFKRTPDVWWIYDNLGRIISKSYYSFGYGERLEYTDRYYYKDNELIYRERYRQGKLTNTYYYKKR